MLSGESVNHMDSSIEWIIGTAAYIFCTVWLLCCVCNIPQSLPVSKSSQYCSCLFPMCQRFIFVACLLCWCDTQSTNLYKSTCTRNLHVCHSFLYKFFLVQVSCTKYNAALLRARNVHARDQNWEVRLVGCITLHWCSLSRRYCCVGCEIIN